MPKRNVRSILSKTDNINVIVQLHLGVALKRMCLLLLIRLVTLQKEVINVYGSVYLNMCRIDQITNSMLPKARRGWRCYRTNGSLLFICPKTDGLEVYSCCDSTILQ